MEGLSILEDYLQKVALVEIPHHQAKFCVPWLVIYKDTPTGRKSRLITDCRAINRVLCRKPFKLDYIQQIFPVSRKNMCAVKIHLEDA